MPGGGPFLRAYPLSPRSVERRRERGNTGERSPGGGPFFVAVDGYPVFGSQAKEKRQYFRRPFGLTCLAKLGKILRDGKTASLIHFSVCRKATGLKSGVSSGVSWTFNTVRR